MYYIRVECAHVYYNIVKILSSLTHFNPVSQFSGGIECDTGLKWVNMK